MLPIIAIVGRPNVGKSTLFNWLTKSRDALVADVPGVTRDRQYGIGKQGDRPYWVIDTGGIMAADASLVDAEIKSQVDQAVDAADCILFVVDARQGLTPADAEIAQLLRQSNKKIVVVANKMDHQMPDVAAAEFHSFGFPDLIAISATRGQGLSRLLSIATEDLPMVDQTADFHGMKIAIVGRPNVGKSTLINRILGEERVVVLDHPGTTRDSIYIPFERRGVPYTLIDTAGVRRRKSKTDMLDKFAILKTLEAMRDAHVIVMVLNGREGILEQDLRLLGRALEFGKALVIAVNKWDGMDDNEKNQVKQAIDRKLPFVNFVRRYFISAAHGTGVGSLYRALNEAFACASKELTTHALTAALAKAIEQHQPPLVEGRRVKPRFAHCGGHHPLTIIVHGKQMDELPPSYKRYLTGYFRSHFNLVGIPLLLHFKNDHNPYVKNDDGAR